MSTQPRIGIDVGTAGCAVFGVVRNCIGRRVGVAAKPVLPYPDTASILVVIVDRSTGLVGRIIQKINAEAFYSTTGT